MKNIQLIIFDLDGTLYNFDSKDFASSKFNADAKERAYKFLSKRLNLGLKETIQTYSDIKEKYSGELSLGLEKEFGIDRYEYFNNVWCPDPRDYISKKSLKKFMSSFEQKLVILTAAPRIWAESVLKYLDIYALFEKNIFTGEPDIRKPNPLAFKQILDQYKVSPSNALSVGDQEHSDIIPAKNLGIHTVIVGSKSLYADFSIDKLEDLSKILKDVK